MSDRVSGGQQEQKGQQSTEAASLEEQKQYAEGKVGAARSGQLSGEDLNAFQKQCADFIDNGNLKAHNHMMAVTKLSEMIFWITSGRQ